MKRSALLVGLTLFGLGLLGVSSAATVPLAGSLDPSFGSHGTVTAGAGGSIGGIAVQPDGKIVVAGTTKGERFLLARYLPDGSPDPTFGDGGYVETPVGGWAFAHGIALQPDGRIVVAGGSYQEGNQADPAVLEEFTLARYNSNGSLDTSFGTDGVTNTVIPEQPDNHCFPSEQAAASALAVLPGGDIVAAGSSVWTDGCSIKSAFDSSVALARYTPSGSLDPTFGDSGIVQTDGPAEGVGIAVRPDGEILATDGDTPYGFAPTGSPNLGFEPDSKLGSADAIAFRNGKIVVAGIPPANRNSKPVLVVARYKKGGHLDSTFGTHGSAVIKRVVGRPTAVLAEHDGKLLVASAGGDLGPSIVARLLPNGRPDRHFGRGGLVSLGDDVSALASQKDGKVLVGRSGNLWALDRLIGGNNCVVPDLRGNTASRANAALRQSYCRRGRTAARFSNTVPRGSVISTAPPKGARLPRGSRVDLTVSRGRRP
jgi:uncharacterized delta-60 repeat protein